MRYHRNCPSRAFDVPSIIPKSIEVRLPSLLSAFLASELLGQLFILRLSD